MEAFRFGIGELSWRVWVLGVGDGGEVEIFYDVFLEFYFVTFMVVFILV